ncbi:AAA family ATPase [Novosphingobium flavum]|uniref:AAA family ATPase n=1 Tax=Novosphingobium flavum TaxID=1778672 RepID=A0A7X1KL73_9SPHN|nr:AAA family ATPase [Novosphingobium flavum]MBC2665262.1 AAA family ATPase [Novosphingobium flavum]
MPTVAIVSQKGGSGKTTLALHLGAAAAYSGVRSCVIDTDPQATAAAWGDWRGEFLPEVVTSPPARIGATIQKVVKNGVELAVIDTPPHADAAARESVKAADLILVPTRPRAFDLHSLETTAELVGISGKPVWVVLNAVPARASKVIADASAVAEGLGLKVCPVLFGERAAFHRSAATGEVARESDPEGKAAAEVDALWQWVRAQIGLPAGA